MYFIKHYIISSQRVYFRLPPPRWWWRCWKWTPRWEWASAAGLPEPWMEISQHNGQSNCHKLNRLADFPLAAAAPDTPNSICLCWTSTRSVGPLLKGHMAEPLIGVVSVAESALTWAGWCLVTLSLSLSITHCRMWLKHGLLLLLNLLCERIVLVHWIYFPFEARDCFHDFKDWFSMDQ